MSLFGLSSGCLQFLVAKAKQKVAKRLKELCKNGWSKPTVPGNCNNNLLLAVDKKLAGVVAFDDIRLCIDARQLNTLNRSKKCSEGTDRLLVLIEELTNRGLNPKGL